MPPTPTLKTSYLNNTIGSLWMVLAMAAFALEDVFIKTASATLPTSQIIIIFGGGGAAIFAGFARFSNEPLFQPAVFSTAMRVRLVFEIFGRLFFILAVTLTPLSTATVILQATPLIVVAGAALLFHEKVGIKRWSAIFVGLIGVVLIVRPASEEFSILSFLAVIGMFGLAGRDLASRAAPQSLSTTILGFYGFASIIIAGILYSAFESQPFSWPDATTTITLLGAIVSGVIAYSGLMKAMRTGEVSAVTPLRYTRLIFGIVFGIWLFDEQLDAIMLSGCALIVASGLFILWRNKPS